jgi:NADH:ubiquinone oxidoreductase subunit E
MMTQEKQRVIARVLAIASGVVVTLSIVFLLVDHFISTVRAPAEKAQVEAMEEAVKMDVEVSNTLTTERDRQTVVSLARDEVNAAVGWILLINSALFLTGMKWLDRFRDQPALTMERLVELKDGPSSGARSTATSPRSTVTAEAPEIDLSFVDHIVAEKGRGPEAAIPILHAIQEHYRYLPDEALKRVCELTEITPAQIAGTSSFYAQFRRSPVGKHIVKVCHGTACHVSGIVPITDEMRRYLAIPPDADTDPQRLFTLDKVACLGCCSLAPVMMIDEHTVGKLTPASACEALRDTEPESSS